MARRKLITVVALAVVVFACSEQAGQMLVDAGEMMMDAGNGMMPDAGAQPGSGYEVPCDETAVVEFNVYSTDQVDGTEVRGALEYRYKQTRYYSWTEVENVTEVVTYSCDNVSEWVPAPPTPASVRQEYVSNEPGPQGDCWVNHGAQYTGNRILTTCRTVTEWDHNEANPDNNPENWGDKDRVLTQGAGRVTIAGTPVAE